MPYTWGHATHPDDAWGGGEGALCGVQSEPSSSSARRASALLLSETRGHHEHHLSCTRGAMKVQTSLAWPLKPCPAPKNRRARAN
eukprot:CAMPEP_0185181892 /NCGR_PEP_ID=MMETSP1140-20130426/960_1 /TAXON_ID=298111 /ORGANISM="Pavlova sp., Strain CCMP459" /LENGTH=84 /DNA_ID=CAMNT_0027747797 /DNA_START=293 /DNA_END=545 /DNA_ORIENTATION=-